MSSPMPVGSPSPSQPGHPYPQAAGPWYPVVPAQRTASPILPGQPIAPPVQPIAPGQLVGPPVVPAQRNVPPAGLDETASPRAIIRREKTRTRLMSLAGVVLFVLFGGTLLATVAPSSPDAAITAATTARTEHAIYGWYNGGGKVILGALQDDMHSMNVAMGGGDLSGVAESCGRMRDDVEAAQRFAPMPDAVAGPHFAAALGHFAQGSANCIDAVAAQDLGLMTRAGDEFSAGSDEINQLDARLLQVAGS